eukprot:779361-Prorocentrum_minimum.AAC.2
MRCSLRRSIDFQEVQLAEAGLAGLATSCAFGGHHDVVTANVDICQGSSQIDGLVDLKCPVARRCICVTPFHKDLAQVDAYWEGRPKIGAPVGGAEQRSEQYRCSLYEQNRQIYRSSPLSTEIEHRTDDSYDATLPNGDDDFVRGMPCGLFGPSLEHLTDGHLILEGRPILGSAILRNSCRNYTRSANVGGFEAFNPGCVVSWDIGKAGRQ